VRPYLDAARRYLWVIVVVLGLTWGAGGAMAYIEYATTFEADATIWTDRQSAQFASLSPQDPGLSSVVTPAQQQAGLLTQLLTTRSFLQQVLQRASMPPPEDAERSFYQEISKRYRVDVLGTNLFRLSYRARDPHTGPVMVMAALAERQDRLAETRMAATAAAATYYRTELDVAQNRVLDAERDLAEFDRTHRPPLSTPDEYTLRQLRITLEDARSRVSELKSRIDASGVLPNILHLADTLDFQVIDAPLGEVKPSGGLRPAALILASAGAAGAAIVAMLIIVGALLPRYRAGWVGARARPQAAMVATSTSFPASSVSLQ
jgi:uncharacterized protein involved in exopolysaccharide biosynthesis